MLLSLLSADNRISEPELWHWIRLAADANSPVAMKRYALSLPTADTQAVITAEVAKDLTNFPVDQIERHLAA